MNIYYCDISRITDGRAAEYLSAERRARTERYLRRDDKARSIMAGLLLRAVLGAESYAQVKRNKYGKPYLAGDVFFNLSHAGEYALLAVAPCKVGVDIEKIVPSADFISSQCFTAAELNFLAEKKSDRAFFRLWTGKESVMKATGLGFRLSPSSFEILPLASGARLINGEQWFLAWRYLKNYVICTATAEKQTIKLIPLSYSELLQKIAER